MAIVARKEGILALTTKNPFTKPIAAPTAKATIIDGNIPVLWSMRDPTRAERATVEPIERSNSPLANMKVNPTAIIEIIAVCLNIFIKFTTDKNPLFLKKNAKTMNIPSIIR